MTIAVTAATGQLGTLVVDKLLERVPASDLVAVVRDAAKAARLADKGVEVRVAGYDDSAALEKAFAGVDRVLLISGTEADRVAQHRRVIDAAVSQGVGRIAYTSVLGAPTSTLPVAPDHQATEQYLAGLGVESVFLRNGWYHENYLPAVETAKQTGSVLTSAGDGRVASAARADFAEAAAVVLTSDDVEGVYELSGDVAWTQAELAATIGPDVTVAEVSAEQQREILTGAGVDSFWAGFIVDTDAAIRRGDLASTPGDLAGLIGRPTTPLADSLT